MRDQAAEGTVATNSRASGVSAGREKSFRDLMAWQKAMQLTRMILRMSRDWPPDERYDFTRQVRRAASSVPLNIAEGQGRLGRAELRHHLSIAHGSICELETALDLAPDYGIADDADLDAAKSLAAEVGRILRGFIRSLDR